MLDLERARDRMVDAPHPKCPVRRLEKAEVLAAFAAHEDEITAGAKRG